MENTTKKLTKKKIKKAKTTGRVKKAAGKKRMCQYCNKVCIDCPLNRGHEDLCKMNPKNKKKYKYTDSQGGAYVAKNKKKMSIPKEWKDKDLSRFNPYKVNSPVYFDGNGNPFN